MDLQGQTTDSTGITRAASAYMHFSKLNSVSIKEELLKEGKDAHMGAISTAVSLKWKSLSEADKAPYEEMAAKDRARYEAECEARDGEVLRLQEEKRKQNSASGETESRIRGSTMQQTDDLSSKIMSKEKKTRVLSAEQQEQKDQRKKAKQDHEDAISSQHESIAEAKAKLAENRLKYLLSQSDIFHHFGVVGSAKSATESKEKESEKKSHRRVASSDDLDDDEMAMAKEADGDNGADDCIVLTKQPNCVKGLMRPYQLEGLNWMIKLHHNGINGVLADEMGLGKTLQSISILGYLREFKQITGPHLIIVPKSTLANWNSECNRWCPDLRVLSFHGVKEERAEIASRLHPELLPHERSWDVCITTYEVANIEKTIMQKMPWRYLIIDEAHRIKNEASQFSRNIRLLSTEHRLLLTGTPLQNNLHELWALLNYLLPDVFASSEQFDEWFNLDVDDVEAKQRMISQLHKILRPFMLRRLKSEVENSLLPKKETILFTGMSAVQKNLYRQVLLRDIDVLQTGGSNSESSRTSILNIVMQLRKCCNHPYLFPGIEDRNLDPLGDHIISNCGKMVLLDKLLVKLKARDNRALIFSQMTRMMDILEDYCISKGYSYCRIDGNTTYNDREDRIAAYNAPNSEIFLFLLSTRAGGLGINLQTADTVILYDSDWNPQADLQAQDRAHRIGQKKQVHVFRLVTDDTVEVKVIERAQQKLKLDAMVVQQGRLAEKEKKMTKDELMETLRFGADKIFRSKDSSITDADIDAIMEAGEKRTEEMTSNTLSAVDKGDMYNFSLDGGKASNTQIFEGKDYSDKALRDNEVANMPFYIDVGKRERKTVVDVYNTTYSSQAASSGMNTNDERPKLPKHLRLPKMEDWQFYDRVRLTELQNEEIRLLDAMYEKKEIPSNLNKIILLSEEEHQEKVRLLESAFSNWSKAHFNNLIRASAKFGRYEYDRIAKEIGQPVEEVKRYVETFYAKGHEVFSASDMERYIKQIEKGEKRLEEIQRLTIATGRLIAMFENPWEELTFKNVGNVGRIFNYVEDRYLLCLTQLHGYGSWDLVRSSIRRCEKFRFDYYIQSCSAETLGKRCEMLMKAAERELLEIDKKKQISTSVPSSLTVVSGVGMSAGSRENVTNIPSSILSNQARVTELMKQVNKETRQLSSARAALAKVVAESAAGKVSTNSAALLKELSGSSGAATKAKPKPSSSNGATNASPGAAVHKPGRLVARPVPEELIPELAQLIIQAGMGGVNKIIDSFQSKYPDVPKRQIDMRISEIGVKEKREGDKNIVWHIKHEYAHYLTMDKNPAGSGSTEENREEVKKAVKRKADGDANETPTKAKQRKVSTPANGSTPNTTSNTPNPTGAPKKHKRAFGFFVKAKRSEAEQLLKADSQDASDTEILKAKLLSMWSNIDEEERVIYEKKEADDKKRYDEEMAIYAANQ